MKSINKYMAALATAGFVIASAVPARAVFESKGTNTLSASAAVGGTATVSITSVEVRNRAGGGLAAGGLAWTGATPGAGWLVSDQYIQMVTNINTTNGGVQIYTDNTAAGANPQFTGPISQTAPATPAGLVNAAFTSQKLPTAWKASASLIGGAIPGINPNAAAGDSFSWFYHADKAQVRNPSLNASNFGNGDPYSTVYAAPGTPLVGNNPDGTTTPNTTTFDNSGLHFAQGPTQFGGYSANATTYIYTEADFTGALAGATYSTNRLILEAFSL